MDTTEKISKLRTLMKENGIDAYVVTDHDPHMSEYVAEHWRARSWISGFTGSAGIFAATEKECCLWTDGRYFIQAEKQLEGSGIRLFKTGLPGTPTFHEWINTSLTQGQCMGFAGGTASVDFFKKAGDSLGGKSVRINKSLDLVGEIWDDRPGIPETNVFFHDLKFTGLSVKEKLDKVRAEMKKIRADYYLVSSLDDIAWLFNIRGGDLPYIAATIAYGLISMDEAFLFIREKKLSREASHMLYLNGVKILDYDEIEKHLKTLGKEKSIAFDPKRTNCLMYDSIPGVYPGGCRKIEIDEITAKLKAVKNSVELENIKRCHINDGIAMVRFLIWLENNIEQEVITEISVAEKLKALRALQPYNLGTSFDTIAAYGGHGAMMHYSATEESKYSLENKGLMVLDSGGQYLNGTTDITRTIVFDKTSYEERRDFTLVLKAHIALAASRFLYGATGSNLDVLARKPLWDVGLDYKSGTGHGVGYCLSVHEGPHSISPRSNSVRLEKGMLVTIEPGIYKEGRYGIRIENMVHIVEDEETESGQFMKFEALTLCPISLKGIVPEMLTAREKEWLNGYHRLVCSSLSPYLQGEEREWLRENTREI